MKSYREYYDLATQHEMEWYRDQKEEWWRKDEAPQEYNDENFHWKRDTLDVRGEYLETTRIKSKHERNDASIIENHTNVNNWEWGILFSMLGQALIDWLIENGHTDLWSFSFHIDRKIDGLNDVFEISHTVKEFDYEKKHWVKCEDEVELLDFAPCSQFLTDIVCEFISRQGNDIPLDWNWFGFGLDELMTSCKYGEWVPASDGSLGFGCRHDKDYDEFVSCL